jgi:hypothetical protein
MKNILLLSVMNEQIKVRLFSYKSYRHYGGREINTTAHICDAIFVADQIDTKVVVLLSDCAGYKKGHKIAVQNNNFDIKS